jgi:hypothetical protein
MDTIDESDHEYQVNAAWHAGHKLGAAEAAERRSHEHDVWLAVYLDSLRAARQEQASFPEHRAATCARHALDSYRNDFQPASEHKSEIPAPAHAVPVGDASPVTP